MLAFDTETRSLRWWENPAFLVSWDVGEGGRVAPLPTDEEFPMDFLDFQEAIGKDKHVVCANIKFDAHMLREAIGVDIFDGTYRVDDVLMMSRLLYGRQRNKHDLKGLAVDFIDARSKDAETEMSDEYKKLSGRSLMNHDGAYYDVWRSRPEIVERYAALDAEYTRRLYEIFWPKIKADGKLLALYELEMKTSRVLYEAERRGVQVDPEAVNRLHAHYAKADVEAREALVEHLGFVPEGDGSQERLREALLDAGVPLEEVTESGEFAVNQRALGKHRDHPAVAALFEWRRAQKFISTYLEPMAGRARIHPTFNQAEAWTGRMSGSNPNMQNIPKRTEVGKDAEMKIRSVFVPSPGMEFIIADFDSIEMRVLAYYLGVPEYRDLIANGDPHAITAAAAWGGRPEDYLKSTSNRWLRDIAKQVTYGIVYGGGGPVVMDTINRMVVDVGRPEYMIDLDQARAIRRKITDAIPGFKELTAAPWKGRSYPQGRLYQQLMASRVVVGDKEYGYVRTLLGRKQWIPLDKAYVALSGIIQGSAADIMKAAAVNLREALLPHGGYPLLFVHDEAVCEVPAGKGEELIPVVVEAMERAANIDPPLKVEANWTARSYAHTD
jgi:DNA polymerase-1